MKSWEVIVIMHDYLNGEITADKLPSSEQVAKAVRDYQNLEAKNKQLLAALEAAQTAIKSLSADALGTAGTDRYQWYLRDELLTKIDKALAAVKGK